jgi:transcription-repair coupling factor (superfamily II helicase)
MRKFSAGSAPGRQPPRPLPPESGFADLEIGDYVVHIEYGIGRFGGLQKRILDNTEREYLIVEYANNDLLYVPIHQADRISRYVGVDDRPPQLNRLGSQDWTRTKSDTRQAVEEVARELLELYAARAQVAGHAFAPDTSWQRHPRMSKQMTRSSEVKEDMGTPARWTA